MNQCCAGTEAVTRVMLRDEHCWNTLVGFCSERKWQKHELSTKGPRGEEKWQQREFCPRSNTSKNQFVGSFAMESDSETVFSVQDPLCLAVFSILLIRLRLALCWFRVILTCALRCPACLREEVKEQSRCISAHLRVFGGPHKASLTALRTRC